MASTVTSLHHRRFRSEGLSLCLRRNTAWKLEAGTRARYDLAICPSLVDFRSVILPRQISAFSTTQGNKEAEGESFQTDAAVATRSAFRLMYFLAMTFNMLLGKIDIRGTYTQSCKAHRDVYIRPPYELRIWGILWMPIVTIYRMMSAGRK